MVNYNFGETIMSQGEPSDGICTLVFGLVRVSEAGHHRGLLLAIGCCTML